ncbi:MAG: ABC-F family ATP-binding cassette domain-containing protein [Saprospiraceae bacterium]|jgi:ATP-binding cassette subfamily F protein uup|nr:ABC-F family ATP-binding cassette domain-containing protein [Saprospiraceae bacterium]
MNFLTLEHVTKTYGEKTLFQDIGLTINKGDKIALVAKNGSGKTTLLRVIAGEESGEGEKCSVLMRKDIKTRFLSQDPVFNENETVIEALLSGDNEQSKIVRQYEILMDDPGDGSELEHVMSRMDDLKAWDYESRVKETLSRFKVKDFNKPIALLSGGQKKRVALAKLIIEEPEFIILDEPTNHLDLEMIEWLEEYLKQPGITLFMVTHDRYFLDRVCNSIIELDAGEIHRYKGNYEAFLEKKAEREENDAVVLGKTKQLFKKELEWMRRQPKARTTKAKSRIDEFDDIKDRAHFKKDDSKVQIDLQSNRLGSKILELHYINKSYGSQKIVEDFFYKFNKKDRVGIVGPNGVGKSTFLRIITGEERPDSGKVVIGETTSFGYYTQDGLAIKSDKRVIDVIQDIAEYVPLEKGKKMTAAQLLERFLFSRAQQQVYVSQLSGGERRRLYLLTILMRNPNFLILDEPTNDLDILTLNVLEEYLEDFPGCLIVVTHDRYFLDKIVDHLFAFEGDGKIKDYNGKYSEYRLEQKQRKKDEKPEKNIVEKPKSNPTALLSNDERKEMMRLEKDIEKIEAEKMAITEKFNDTTMPLDEINLLANKLESLKMLQETKEMRWMELCEKAG